MLHLCTEGRVLHQAPWAEKVNSKRYNGLRPLLSHTTTYLRIYFTYIHINIYVFVFIYRRKTSVGEINAVCANVISMK